MKIAIILLTFLMGLLVNTQYYEIQAIRNNTTAIMQIGHQVDLQRGK